MPEMYSQRSGFTESACEGSAKTSDRIWLFKESNDVRYVFRNKIEKVCFHDDHAYSSGEDLVKRTEADKVLKDKSINVANDA